MGTLSSICDINCLRISEKVAGGAAGRLIGGTQCVYEDSKGLRRNWCHANVVNVELRHSVNHYQRRLTSPSH